jgi:hypothetical protein
MTESNRQLFRTRFQRNNVNRRTVPEEYLSNSYTFINPESYDESLTQTTIPITEISKRIFKFIVKIIKEPDYIYNLIPNTSRLSMKQRHHKIAILITWFLMIMKKLSRNNENIPQYLRLFDQFERTIGIYIMNENWFDNNPIHQYIVKHVLQQWFYFKYI